MHSIQALREQRAAKAKSLHDLVGKTDWNADIDQPIYDTTLAEIDALDAQISRINEANKRLADETLSGQVIVAAERIGKDQKSEDARIFAKWLRGGDQALNAQDWAHIRNTMSTTTNSEGGYTVASEVATSVLDALKKFGGMRAVATVIRTSTGGGMTYPTSDGTAEEGEIVDQNASASDADVSFGAIALPVYKYSSKVVTVPFELLQDSSVDVEAFVNNRLVKRLGRITNRHFTTGTGSSQPNGVVTAASVGVTASNGSSQVTAVTYDSLVDLEHSVDPEYREQGNCSWMFNDTTLRSIRKIKDSNGRPIFVPGYEQDVPGGAPARLMDHRIQINQSVANMGAGNKSILFGDFSNYVVRDVMDVTMFRFTDSAYTKKGQVGFLAWLRSGGNLVDVGGAVKVFVNAAS